MKIVITPLVSAMSCPLKCADVKQRMHLSGKHCDFEWLIHTWLKRKGIIHVWHGKGKDSSMCDMTPMRHDVFIWDMTHSCVLIHMWYYPFICGLRHSCVLRLRVIHMWHNSFWYRYIYIHTIQIHTCTNGYIHIHTACRRYSYTHTGVLHAHAHTVYTGIHTYIHTYIHT